MFVEFPYRKKHLYPKLEFFFFQRRIPIEKKKEKKTNEMSFFKKYSRFILFFWVSLGKKREKEIFYFNISLLLYMFHFSIINN